MMALYNNGYPATYQPMYQPYTPMQVQQNVAPVQQPMQGSPIWVQGESGAKSYLVAPNSTVQLWDSESQTIYLKSADASGMPTMKVLDYTVRESDKNSPISRSGAQGGTLSGYATKEEIKAISERITAINKRLDDMQKEDANE